MWRTFSRWACKELLNLWCTQLTSFHHAARKGDNHDIFGVLLPGVSFSPCFAKPIEHSAPSQGSLAAPNTFSTVTTVLSSMQHSSPCIVGFQTCPCLTHLPPVSFLASSNSHHLDITSLWNFSQSIPALGSNSRAPLQYSQQSTFSCTVLLKSHLELSFLVYLSPNGHGWNENQLGRDMPSCNATQLQITWQNIHLQTFFISENIRLFKH